MTCCGETRGPMPTWWTLSLTSWSRLSWPVAKSPPEPKIIEQERIPPRKGSNLTYKRTQLPNGVEVSVVAKPGRVIDEIIRSTPSDGTDNDEDHNAAGTWTAYKPEANERERSRPCRMIEMYSNLEAEHLIGKPSARSSTMRWTPMIRKMRWAMMSLPISRVSRAGMAR